MFRPLFEFSTKRDYLFTSNKNYIIIYNIMQNTPKNFYDIIIKFNDLNKIDLSDKLHEIINTKFCYLN